MSRLKSQNKWGNKDKNADLQPQGPRQTYPPIDFVPDVSLDQLREEVQWQIELVEQWRQSPFYTFIDQQKQQQTKSNNTYYNKVERYSDMFRVKEPERRPLDQVVADQSLFPTELFVAASSQRRMKQQQQARFGQLDMMKALNDTVAQARQGGGSTAQSAGGRKNTQSAGGGGDEQDNNNGQDDDDDDDQQQQQEEEMDISDEEEENDYIESYFDNGEGDDLSEDGDNDASY
ncbi:hypothetical protein MIR68_001555 [Amoeboaphelidium protococcarum]|nr:hypothetical protein MIR68_001555 [Amoeboaphelidium protococcarum]